MFEILISLTLVVLIFGITIAVRSTDMLHPMLFLGPLFIYGTVIDPWLVRDHLYRFFATPEDLNIALLLNLLAVIALAAGALHRVSAVRQTDPTQPKLRSSERTYLLRIALALAIVAIGSYVYGITNVGGFMAAFSKAKGGGNSGFGYINEAMNLGLVAAAMVALSRIRRGWTAPTMSILLIGVLPNFVQGTFGGRRGPLFLAMTALMASWMITRRRTPSFMVLGACLAAVILGVAFVGSQRQHLYLGSDDTQIDWQAFQSTLSQSEVSEGNNFVYGAAFVLATHYSGQYTWGRELAVNLIVRPIPRQLWPTKYEDVGAVWVTSDYPGLGHLTRQDWMNSVGWLPLPGSSAISISDLFGEFGWGAVFLMYLVGRAFAYLWARRLLSGGIWEMLYLEALFLSIYLATQGFGAFYYRYLLLALPTIGAWKLISRKRRQRHVAHGLRSLTT